MLHNKPSSSESLIASFHNSHPHSRSTHSDSWHNHWFRKHSPLCKKTAQRQLHVVLSWDSGISSFGKANPPKSWTTSRWHDQTCRIASGVPIPAPRGSPAGPNQWFCGAPCTPTTTVLSVSVQSTPHEEGSAMRGKGLGSLIMVTWQPEIHKLGKKVSQCGNSLPKFAWLNPLHLWSHVCQLREWAVEQGFSEDINDGQHLLRFSSPFWRRWWQTRIQKMEYPKWGTT